MLDVLRLALLIAVLGAASYYDVRTREIPDGIWIAGMGAGTALYALDWHETDYFVLFSLAAGAAISLAVWRLFPMGGADALAVLTVSVVYPVSFDTVITPAVAFFGGLVLEHMAALFYNVRYNTEDAVRGRLFAGMDCPWHVKAAAFYSVHRRRPHEKFTFCAEAAESGRRSISLRTPPADSEYEQRSGVFVTWAMPALPFMLAATVSGAIVAAMIIR